jgi:hypothetical protein
MKISFRRHPQRQTEAQMLSFVAAQEQVRDMLQAAGRVLDF